MLWSTNREESPDFSRGEYVKQISYKEHTISFDVCGDSYIGVQKNGVDYVVAHRGGSRPIYDDDEALEILENDETFYKLIEENNVVFENNNWVNIIIIGPNGDYVSEPEVADQDNLLYAALAAFEPCADYIDQLIAASAK